MKKLTSTRKVFNEKCIYCNKQIKGFSESHCKYNKKLHEEGCKK